MSDDKTTTPYRPSNGDEGLWFMSEWCDRCVKDTEGRPCRILGRTLAFGIHDKNYPHQWVQDEGGPRCTAFSDHRAPRKRFGISRDKRQEALL